MSQALWAIAGSFFGSLGFALLYNLRGKRPWIPAAGGALFWAFYLLFRHQGGSAYMGFFASAVLLTAYAELWAIALKTPVTVFLIPTVIPFIPGGGLYYSVSALLRGDMPAFAAKSVETLGLAMALAVGIMLVTSLARPARLFLDRLRH